MRQCLRSRFATFAQAALQRPSRLQRAWLVHSRLTPYRSLKTGTISLHLIACRPASGEYQLHATIHTHKGNLMGLGVPIRHRRLLHCRPSTGRTCSMNSSLWLCIVWYTHHLCQPNDALCQQRHLASFHSPCPVRVTYVDNGNQWAVECAYILFSSPLF